MDPLWPRNRQRHFLLRRTALTFAFSAALTFSLHCFALSLSPLFAILLPSPVITDLLNDGSKYYGRPMVTVGAIAFGVSSDFVVSELSTTIGSWLRSSAQVVVHLYDIVGGTGALSFRLLERLQLEFGADRVLVRGIIMRQKKVEVLPEAFGALERNAETVYGGWFRADAVVPPDWIEYVYAAQRYFGEYKNFSLHFARRDILRACRGRLGLNDVMSMGWGASFGEFRQKCGGGLHSSGYDCYLWNLLGISMTRANIPPAFVGYADDDGTILTKQMEQGWYVSTYPWTESYRMERPDSSGGKENAASGKTRWRNDDMNISLSLTSISERRNGTWNSWKLDRPPGAFPLAYQPDHEPQR
jgi:hypothetical protein